MKPKQFIAPTARQALAMVRREIGPDAVILQNRAVAEGVAVTAVAESELVHLDYEQADAVPASPVSVISENRDSRDSLDKRAESRDAPNTLDAQNTSDAMSTVRFQDFANERRARREKAMAMQKVSGLDKDTDRPDSELNHAATRDETSAQRPARRPLHNETVIQAPQTATRFEHFKAEPVEPAPAWQPEASQTAHEMQSMVHELRKMRSFISQQFSALAWVDGVRRTPSQAAMLRLMIESGFSAKLARVLVSRLPDSIVEQPARTWLRQSLVRNLRCACFDDGQLDRGGVFALVGPTGVGKTTSAAKIAARFAARNGPDSVGLISADAYRVAGQDQLIRYGRMIGTAVHTARDAEDLGVQLDRLQDKALVLIDTAGLGQRDPRVTSLLSGLSQGAVQRLMVVSASAQSEVLDETLDAYRADQSAGIVLTKTDEACLLGGALDILIRHRLPLLAVGNGQRVPEDWVSPDPDALIGQALAMAQRSGGDLGDIELTMLMQRIEPLSGFSDGIHTGSDHV
ncbi:MAG: flagellar biosynthesis protein FlhF [Burkholderiaceae bacterium]